jgi:hypothetical protein
MVVVAKVVDVQKERECTTREAFILTIDTA